MEKLESLSEKLIANRLSYLASKALTPDFKNKISMAASVNAALVSLWFLL